MRSFPHHIVCIAKHDIEKHDIAKHDIAKHEVFYNKQKNTISKSCQHLIIYSKG